MTFCWRVFRVAAALVLFAFGTSAAEWDGWLCFAGASPRDCIVSKSNTVSFAPLSSGRAFVWTDRTGRNAVLGVIAAGVERVVLAKAPAVSFRFKSNSAEWPSITTLRVRAQADAAAQWTWIWDARRAAVDHSIVLPEGDYELEVKAARHRVFRQTFHSGAKAQRLGDLRLNAAFMLTGEAVDRTSRVPVGSAKVTLLDGTTTVAFADPLGRIDCEIPDPWPEALELHADGYGMQVIELPRAPSDMDLGTIELAPGGSIRVSVDGAPAGTRVLLAGDTRVIARQQLDAERHDVVFTGLEAGRYTIAIRGAAPMQQFVRHGVEVEEKKESRLPISIVPHSMKLTTYVGEKRLPNAAVTFTHSQPRWKAQTGTGANAELETELWQTGEFLVWVESPEIKPPYGKVVDVPDTKDIDLDLRLPDLRISGRVVDSRSGEPVRDAKVQLESTRDDTMTSSIGATTDDEGRYEYRVVAPGHHKISARAAEHVASQPVEFDLREADVAREVNMRLAPGVTRRIEVFTAAGTAAVRASVAECASNRLLQTHETDASGVVEVTIPEGESRTLFVVPREGSFAFVRVDGRPGESAPVRVVIAPAVGSLRIVTRKGEQEPAPEVMLLLRFNGEVFPLYVLQILGKVQGLQFMTNRDGVAVWRSLPAGRYEFWPATGRSEVEAIFAGVGPPPPAALDLRSGENEAILTFSPAQRKGAGN